MQRQPTAGCPTLEREAQPNSPLPRKSSTLAVVGWVLRSLGFCRRRLKVARAMSPARGQRWALVRRSQCGQLALSRRPHRPEDGRPSNRMDPREVGATVRPPFPDDSGRTRLRPHHLAAGARNLDCSLARARSSCTVVDLRTPRIATQHVDVRVPGFAVSCPKPLTGRPRVGQRHASCMPWRCPWQGRAFGALRATALARIGLCP
jgi:hypothetical protein